MDTIIYFYQKRKLERPLVEALGQGDYLLIKVAMDVGDGRWFLQRLPEAAQYLPSGVLPMLEAGELQWRGEESGARWKGRKQQCGEESSARQKGRKQQCGEEKDARQKGRGRRCWEENGARQSCGEQSCPGKRFFHRWKYLLQERRRKRITERSRERWQEALKRECEEVEAQIIKLVRQIGEFVEDWQDCRCVYDRAVARWLLTETEEGTGGETGNEFREETDREARREADRTGSTEDVARLAPEDVRNVISRLWQQHWDIPELERYFEMQWVEPLLVHAALPHFVILGTASCVPEVILKCADRMRSLRWVLCEEDCTQKILDFVEDFYLDYGLAVTLQTLEKPKGFRGFGLKCPIPSCILDFTREQKIQTGFVARGSVWLDMGAVEEKERSFSDRDTGISYFSIRRLWRKAERKKIDPAMLSSAGGRGRREDWLPGWFQER